MQTLGRLIATAGFTGYAPFAPGTVGSIVGLVALAGWRAGGGGLSDLIALLVLVPIGVWAADVTERQAGIEDPGLVVIDEVAGMFVTLFAVPLGWSSVTVGFVAFRVFDILKPFPARQCERLGGGLGIMADDLVAGVYAALVVRLVVWITSGPVGS